VAAGSGQPVADRGPGRQLRHAGVGVGVARGARQARGAAAAWPTFCNGLRIMERVGARVRASGAPGWVDVTPEVAQTGDAGRVG